MSLGIAWLLLVLSGVLDVAWAFATKRADGFNNLPWGLLSLVLLTLFIGFLTKALQVLPLGTAYAVWTGIGVVGTVSVGIAFFGESASLSRLLCVSLVLVGILGLRLLPS